LKLIEREISETGLLTSDGRKIAEALTLYDRRHGFLIIHIIRLYVIDYQSFYTIRLGFVGFDLIT